VRFEFYSQSFFSYMSELECYSFLKVLATVYCDRERDHIPDEERVLLLFLKNILDMNTEETPYKL
jgi:hypothetical protein